MSNASPLVLLILMLFLLCACDSERYEEPQLGETDMQEQFNAQESIWDDLDLNISIKLNDSIFSSCDSIKMEVRLLNNQNSAQRFLFDKPAPMNPTQLEIIDENRTSVVKVHYGILTSTAWSFEELNEFYYELEPNQSILREFSLTKIAVMSNPDLEIGNLSFLKDGDYSLRIKFGKNQSNIQNFTIKKHEN